jgi:hypothetical protein
MPHWEATRVALCCATVELPAKSTVAARVMVIDDSQDIVSVFMATSV